MIKHINEHIPSAFALHCISRVSDYQPEPIVRVKTKPDENMVKEFLDTITSWVHGIHERFNNPKTLTMSAKELYDYEESNNCWICGKEFYLGAPWKDWKVRITIILQESLGELHIIGVI